MIELHQDEIVVAFPELDGRAELRIYFESSDAPGKKVDLHGSASEAFQLQLQGRFVVHLRPTWNFLPFAALMFVDGLNAITGDASLSLARAPQNYVATPPQGAVDGYFRGGEVRPFIAERVLGSARSLLTFKVHPIKPEVFEHWKYQTRITGRWNPVIRGLTLKHGGMRECEPLYEDMCTTGDWDTSRGEELAVFLKQ